MTILEQLLQEMRDQNRANHAELVERLDALHHILYGNGQPGLVRDTQDAKTKLAVLEQEMNDDKKHRREGPRWWVTTIIAVIAIILSMAR